MTTQTRVRYGAIALAVSALLFLAFQLFHPVSSLDLTDAAKAAATFGDPVFVFTDALLIVSYAFLPLGLIAIYGLLADRPGGTWALTGIALLILAIGPFQAFSGVGTFGFSAAAQSILAGNAEAIDVLGRMVQGPSLPFGLTGVGLIIIGAIVLAVAIWRSGALPKWAGVAFAAGLVLFIVAVASPEAVQKGFRIADGLLMGIGGMWLAWALWWRPVA